MENLLTNSENPKKCKSKKTLYIHNILSEVSHIIKIQNLDHRKWSDFFL